MPQQDPNQIIITNFGGRLTRKLNGDMNSGFSKFTTSFGYDPFSKPDNLTWLEQPTSVITGSVLSTPLAAIHRTTSAANPNIYMIDATPNLYRIQPNKTNPVTPSNDSVIGVSSLTSASGPLFGSSMKIYGSVVGGIQANDPFIYFSHDSGVSKVKTDGTGEATVVTSNVAPNMHHSLETFIGKLIFANGNTVAAISQTGTVTSSIIGTGVQNLYSQLNPPLDTNFQVKDLDVSIDQNYLLISASTTQSERIDTNANDGQNTSAADGQIVKWNGTDDTVTAGTNMPGNDVESLQTYLGNSLIFSNDPMGLSINDGVNKLLFLPNNKAPLPNATDVNGNFLLWAAPEVSTSGTTRYMSLYYYGALDEENSVGLYRVLRWTTTQSNGQVFQVPLCLFVNSKYQSFNNSNALATLSYGKHYIGLSSLDTSGNQKAYLLAFLITPTGSGTPQAGVYETQTQLFSKKKVVKQIRVYTEPTASGNGFQLDLIGSDGNVITNGTVTYTFTAGTDVTLLQGSLERIDFNPAAKASYALGLRITNTGTTNMTIHKVEIDLQDAGK